MNKCVHTGDEKQIILLAFRKSLSEKSYPLTDVVVAFGRLSAEINHEMKNMQHLAFDGVFQSQTQLADVTHNFKYQKRQKPTEVNSANIADHGNTKRRQMTMSPICSCSAYEARNRFLCVCLMSPFLLLKLCFNAIYVFFFPMKIILKKIMGFAI